MYNISDKRSSIRNLQLMLGLNPTGRYDAQIIREVSRIQQLYSLDINGVVDEVTFYTIVRHTKKERCPNIIDTLFPFDTVYKYGDYLKAMEPINMILSFAISRYNYHGILPRGKYFSRDTLKLVKKLRDIYRLDNTEYIDRILINRIFCDNLMI